jgi:hypothetical protein
MYIEKLHIHCFYACHASYYMGKALVFRPVAQHIKGGTDIACMPVA